MFRWKKSYFCRSVVKVLVFLMVMHGLPLWELSQSYEWIPRNYVTKALNQIVSILNHGAVEAASPPVADAGDERSQMKNQSLGVDIVLDGTASNDPDGDPLTYQWYGPFVTTSGSKPSVQIPEGTYTISLIVDDGTTRSEVDTAAITITPCFNISARAKSGKVQLTWTHQDGTERYDVYRADEADPFSFEKIDETTSTYSTYLDEPVANETTYLYVVGALSQGEWCYSNVISSHPTATRTRGTVNYAPVIYSSAITNGTTGIIYNYDVNATDPNGNVLSYSLFDHPVGMDIDPDTGLITWTPNEAGSYDVTAEISDSKGGTDTQNFTIVVGPIIVPNRSPVANAGGPYEGQVNSPISFDGSQSYDPDGDKLTFTWNFGDGSPQGNGMHVTHVYDQEGTYQAALTVEDGRGGVDTATAQVTVTPPPEMDLQPITMDVSAVVVDPQTLEMTGTVGVEIRNNGTTYIADSYELALYEDTNMNQILDVDADQLLGSSTIAHGPAGGNSITVSVDITGTTLFAGNLIYVFVDSDNQIEELCEDNNITNSMADCEYTPPIGSFDPVLEWSWTSSSVFSDFLNVMMTPVVIDLNEDGIPDVVFGSTSSRGGALVETGVLRAVSGDSGIELFTVTDSSLYINTASSIAAGDIDLDGKPEILACDASGARLIAFEHDGVFKWRSSVLEAINWGAVALADMDLDGTPEIIIGRQVINNDGSIRWTGSGGRGSQGSVGPLSFVADVNLDGSPEVVAGNTVYTNTGDIYWQASLPDGYNAVANFDDDPFPEIVLVSGGSVWLLEHDGSVKWGPVSIPGGGRGGPPTVADFDSDGEVEIGVAGASRYAVFETNGTLKWAAVTQDGSSNVTGSSVFDFEGDGSAEVVYRDELKFRIHRGTDGAVLFETPMSSCTWYEYVLVADVDNDGNAEIVAVANDNCGFGSQRGVYVFGDANDTWVNTRNIWNQHAYSITNVNDDGTIPRIAANNWEIFNNFRQNQLVEARACVDLTASYVRADTTTCPDAVEIIARIGNGGALHTAPGIKVAFYDGDPDNGGIFLGTADLNNRLDPGEYADIGFAPQNPLLGIHTIYVVVDDDGMGHGMVSEIDEVNNKAWATFDLCNNPPIITSSPITTGIEGIQYTYDVDATDPDSDTLVYTLALFSENMTIDESTGLIQWVPLSTHIGSHSIIVSVSDGRGGIATQSFTITVEGTTNNPPGITSAPVIAAIEGSTYTCNVEASDADNDVLTFSLTTAPATMTIDPGSGLVQWTPCFTDAGSHAVEVKVVDGRGGEDTQAFVIEVEDVNFPPQITSAPVTTATEGVLYEYDVIATDDDGDALTFSLLTAPAGMTIDSSTGLIQWTPTSAQVGDSNVTVRVEDSGGLFDTQGFIITVEGANHPPVITSDPITVFSFAEGTQSNFRPGELFISSSLTDEIRVYDAETLEFIQAFTHPLFNVPGSPPFSFGPNGSAFNNRGNFVVAAYSHFVEFSDYGAEYARYPKSVSEANETLIFDPMGNLYTTTATGGSNLLNQYSASDYSFQQSVTLPPGAGQLTGITFDDQRRIYVGSQADAKIHVFSADETFSTFTYVNSFDAPASGWMGVEGLQINQNGELVVACADMFRYNPQTGAILGTFDAPFDSLPVPVTIDNLGRIYVADFENGSGTVGADIIRFSSDGSSFIHVNDANLFGPFGLVISGTSLPGGPSPRYVYDVDATDPDDGDVLTFSLDVAPAGMEIDPITGLIVWPSKDMQVGDHSVTVRVEDGASLFDNQSFTVTVADVNERPVADAGSDQIVFAGDAVILDGSGSSDVNGDLLTYQWSFTSIPSGSGATLSDPAIVNPTFVADFAGTYMAQLVVNDGTVDSDPDTVEIAATEQMITVPDFVGMGQAAAEAAIIAANLSVGNITTQNSATVPTGNVISQDPVAGASVSEGSAVDLVVSLGPVMITVPDVVGQLQADAEAAITDAGLAVGNITETNSDTVPAGHVISQNPPSGISVPENTTVNLEISIGPEVEADYEKPDLFVQLNHEPALYESGEDVIMTITATDNSGSVTAETLLDGNVISTTLPNTFISTTDLDIGNHSLVVSAIDPSGNSTLENRVFVITDPGDTVFPIASITSPDDGNTVTELVDIAGTASDTNLFKYEIAYAPMGTDDFTVFKVGTESITNGVLGIFDPALVTNGLYTIRLSVIDGTGRVISDEVLLNCKGEQEVGNFSVAFRDLEVNIGDLPIAITRVYDSRKRGVKGDFGFGWSIDLIRGIKAEPNDVLGEGWTQTVSGGWLGNTYCIAPASGSEHYVMVTYPGGKQEKFLMKARLNNGATCQQFVPIINQFIIDVYFEEGDLGSTLSVMNADSTGLLLDSSNALFDWSWNVFNPTTFRLTTASGWSYNIDKAYGLVEIRDPNGNEITINSNGITHSAGLGVAFTRDAQGRIAQITDPDGHVREYQYDSFGNLEKAIDAEGNETGFTYNSTHGLVKYVDGLGRLGLQNEYDDSGRLIAQINGEGKRFEFIKTPGTRQEILRDFEGRTTVIERDERGNIISETDDNLQVTLYQYNADNNLIRRQDPEGNVWEWTWDSSGNKLSEKLPGGATTHWEYNDKNKITKIIDSRGNETTFAYDANGNKTGETDPLGYSYSKTYSPGGKLASFTDKGGYSYTYKYDGNGRRIKETKPDGSYVEWTYDGAGNVLTERRYKGDTTLFSEITNTYSANGDLIQTNDNGKIFIWEYDGNGNLLKKIDPDGKATVHFYDANNTRIGTVYPDGSRQDLEADSQGNVTAFSNAAGRSIDIEYNQQGKMTKITYADGTVVENTYDSSGNRIEINDRGSITRYEYNSDGRVTRLIGPLGNVTSYTYDGNGNKVTETDPNSNTTSFSYDALNRLITITYADGTTRGLEYNGLGWKTAEIDQNGHRIEYTYDSNGNLTSVKNTLGETTTFTYDAAGNRISEVDALGLTIAMTYNANKRLASKTFPDGSTETYEYDGKGNLIRSVDRAGGTTVKTYTSNGRLESITYPTGKSVNYTYTNDGKISAIESSDGSSITYDFDLMGRVVKVDYHDGRYVEYAYDGHGNRTLMTTPEGTITYLYDIGNRLVSVTDMEGGITQYSYDAAGNQTGVSYPNGNQADYIYDILNRLLKIETRDAADSVLTSHQYSLAPNGMRTSVVDIVNGLQTSTAYTYDVAYRLIGETKRDSLNALIYEAAYTYDAVGNRLTKLADGVATTYTYNNLNQLIAESSGGQTIAYEYNLLGQLVRKSSSDGTFADYDYNESGKLSRNENDSGEIATIEYDLLGNISEKAVNGTTLRYLVDPQRALAEIIAEYDGAGNVSATYIFGNDLVKMRRSGINSYYLYDGLGSTRALTNAIGAITDSYSYDAFGNLLTETGATENDHLFTGEKYDANIGYYYLRARMYDPSAGRFTSCDPHAGNIYDPATLHKYLYVANNPVNFVDPSGEFFGGLVGISVSLSIQNILVAYHVTMLKILIKAMNIAKTMIEPGYIQRDHYLMLIVNGVFLPGVDQGFGASLEMIRSGYKALGRMIGSELQGFFVSIAVPVKIKFGKTLDLLEWDIASIINSPNQASSYIPILPQLKKLKNAARASVELAENVENDKLTAASGWMLAILSFLSGAL